MLLAVMAVSFLYFGVYKVATGQAQMDVQTAFLTMLILLIIGEVISTATKAFVPSMFISAVLFVLGFWAYFPKDILQVGGIAANLPTFLVMMMVVHLGTMLDIKELIEQWKTVVITLAGMLGILVVILTLGTVVLDKTTAAIAAPPLTGGFVAAMMMQSVATTEQLAIRAMAVYVLQGFIGYPLTSICLKAEGRKLLKDYRSGNFTVAKAAAQSNTAAADDTSAFIFPQIPAKYKSDFTYLFTMVILTVMSGYLDTLSHGYISKFVWALILGVFGTAFGFIEKNTLVRSRSMGFIYTVIMMFVFSHPGAAVKGFCGSDRAGDNRHSSVLYPGWKAAGHEPSDVLCTGTWLPGRRVPGQLYLERGSCQGSFLQRGGVSGPGGAYASQDTGGRICQRHLGFRICGRHCHGHVL